MSTVTAAHYPELYLAGLRYHSFGPRVVAPPPTPAPALPHLHLHPHERHAAERGVKGSRVGERRV